MNPQVRNFQRCKSSFHQYQVWVKWHLALHLLLLTMFQLYHLPPPVSNFSCLFTRCQPLDASCCTLLLYFSRYCTGRLKIFSLLFVFVSMYYLHEKYYKLITFFLAFYQANWHLKKDHWKNMRNHILLVRMQNVSGG